MKTYLKIFFAWLIMTIIAGIVFTFMWNWFVAPLGVVKITIPWGIGLLLMSTFLKTNIGMANKSKNIYGFLIGYSLASLTVGLIGFLIKTYLM